MLEKFFVKVLYLAYLNIQTAIAKIKLLVLTLSGGGSRSLCENNIH